MSAPNILRPLPIAAAALLLQACGGGSDSSDPSMLTATELNQFSAQTQILAPATSAVVIDAAVTVRATIPAAAEATRASLLVDGVAIATDSDGSPWEFEWPAYFWGDSNAHSLALNVTASTGQQYTSQAASSVVVSSTVAADLSFVSPSAPADIKDTDAFDVELNALTGADAYSVEVTGPEGTQEIETTSLSAKLSDLVVGSYSLRFRASGEFGGQMRSGPFSAAVGLFVLPPDLPQINATQVDRNGGIFSAVLSWDDVAPDDNYTVELRRAGTGDSELFTTSDNMLEVANLPLGTHTWTLLRTNSVGHQSAVSDMQLIEAGVFTRTFAGSGSNSGRKILATNDDGVIVHAWSSSPEVSATIDSRGDDWVFKVDGNGTLVWQHVEEVEGFPRFRDITVLADGDIVAFGNSEETAEFVALKLSAQGDVLWRASFPADPAVWRVRAYGVIEFDSRLYGFGIQSNDPDCAYSCPTVSIVSFDPATGAMVDVTTLPTLGDRQLIQVASLQRSRSGGWLVAGTSGPLDNPDIDEQKPTVVRLNEDFTVLDVFVDERDSFDVFLIDMIEAPDESLLLLTSEFAEFLNIHSVSADFQTVSRARDSFTTTWSGVNERLLLDDSGNFGILNSGGPGATFLGGPVQFTVFDPDSLEQFDDFELDSESDDRLGTSIALMGDGTAIVLIDERLGPQDSGIVLLRRVVE